LCRNRRIQRDTAMNVDRGYNVRIPLLLGISGLLFIQTAGALSFQDFVQCVGASGQGAVCQLDPGIYPVSETIGIGRSHIPSERRRP